MSTTPGTPAATAPLGGITEADIANYLVNNPSFFERHADVLGAVQLGNPHGTRAVSLHERQMQMQRDKIKGLEHRIMDMIRHGQENMVIEARVHRFVRAVLLARRAQDVPQTLVDTLQHEFLIPQAALRLWNLDDAPADAAWARPCSEDIRTFASSLTLPYCGPNAGFEAAEWLSEQDATGAQTASMAMIPLRHGDEAFGLLVLGSPDPTRYTADMGTEFLMRVGEVASAALSRLHPPA